MEEKIFIKEKKKASQSIMIFIVALIGGIIGSILTYLVIDEKVDLNEVAMEALGQIEEKKYVVELQECDIRQITKIGIALIAIPIQFHFLMPIIQNKDS